MELRSFESIVRELRANEVRFLVVGGMAVVAHGYGRLTHDLDLVLALDPETSPATPVDLFVEEPFDFEKAYQSAILAEVDGAEFRYVDLRTLIEMKEAAGRPVDLEDVRQLRLLDDEA